MLCRRHTINATQEARHGFVAEGLKSVCCKHVALNAAILVVSIVKEVNSAEIGQRLHRVQAINTDSEAKVAKFLVMTNASCPLLL